jgi:hypothetical protein
MTSLRQRLLLVVGWAVVAVATGLVSAGAVAVAGGQVNDRPLRPLSAAEVAALPVTIEDPCVTSEPLASGGSASLTNCLAPESDNSLEAPGDDTARPTEKELLPGDEILLASTGHALPTDFDEAGDYGEEPEVPRVGPRPPEPEIVELVGGRVSISLVDGSLVLNAATPRAGFVTDLLFERGDELTVTFWDGEHLSSLSAEVIGEELSLTSSEEGV